MWEDMIRLYKGLPEFFQIMVWPLIFVLIVGLLAGLGILLMRLKARRSAAFFFLMISLVIAGAFLYLGIHGIFGGDILLVIMGVLFLAAGIYFLKIPFDLILSALGIRKDKSVDKE